MNKMIALKIRGFCELGLLNCENSVQGKKEVFFFFLTNEFKLAQTVLFQSFIYGCTQQFKKKKNSYCYSNLKGRNFSQ